MSKEIFKSELDIFKKNYYQNSIEGSQLMQFYPVSALNSTNNLEFFIPPQSEYFIDPDNIFLWLTIQLVKPDGTDYGASQDNRFSLINYGLMTMWQQLDISLNNTLITPSTNTFPYTAYLDVLTKYDNKSHHTYLRSGGYVPYKTSLLPDNINPDLAELSNSSKKFKLYGRIFNELSECDRFILNGVSIRFNFIAANNSFATMGSSAISASTSVSAKAATTPIIKIVDASMFARHVKLTPMIFNIINKSLLKPNGNAIYPIKRRNTILFNLPSGQSTFSIDNIFLGQLPDQLIIGLVEHNANVGNYELNPLAFKNFNLCHICVYLNGEPFPKTPYTPDYLNDNYQREFFDFHNEQGLTNGVGLMDSTYKMYKDITNLYCFNFNQDFSNSSKDYINLSREGSLRVEVKFTSDLTKALKLVCFGRFDSNIEIDSNRNVITDF